MFAFIMSIRTKTTPHCVTYSHNALMALTEVVDVAVGHDGVFLYF
jgi:hypothetical protein